MNEVYDTRSIGTVLDWNCIGKDLIENGILALLDGALHCAKAV